MVLVLLLSGCTSSPPKGDPPPKTQDPPAKPAEKPAEKPTATKPAEPQPSRPTRTQPASDADALTKATSKGWEKGRIALIVELIVKSKSFDRGFESALLFIPDMRDGVTAAVVEGASSRDGRTSERCLETLGAMAHLRLIPDAQRKTTVETVTRRVKTDTAPGSWAAAVNALGSLAGHDAGQDVTDALGRAVDEDCPPVIRACAEVLGDIQFHDAANALILALNRARDRYAARGLVRALGRLGGKEATRRLMDALNAPDAADREVAASALGEAGGSEAASALRSTIERPDETPSVRRAAIAALERMGGEEAVKALKTCLEDLAGRREETWVVTTRDISETLERLQRK